MMWLEVIEKFAPLTVATAVILFVARELIESVRRYRSRARKAEAIRTLLVEELELNKWAIGSLKNILKEIASEMEFDSESKFLLKRDASGGVHYRCRRSDGGGGGSAIPDVHRKHYDAFLPDLAEVDRVLFEEARKGYEGIGQLEHVRNSLVAYLAEDEPDERCHLQGFPSYGLGVLDKVERKMGALYVFCCGRPYEKARLR